MNCPIKIVYWRQSLILAGWLAVNPWLSNPAYADIYVDLESDDEIIITTQSLNESTAIRLQEPQLGTQYTQINNPDLTHLLPYNHEVMIAAEATQLEPAFIHAVIAAESQHNARAISKKGASGLMQLMPATARRFNVLNQYDPQQNILAGSRYLKELSNLFNGDLSLILAAYNAGPTAVQKYHGQIPPYFETLNYVPKVLKYYRHFSSKKSG